MKKILSVLLCMVMLLSILPMGIVSVSAGTSGTYGDLTYTITDGEVAITGCNSSASGALTIPSEIDGYPVTSIGKEAFYYCTGLTSITIPDGVMSVGNEAFYKCANLISITIPESVTSIGSSAFSDCTNLIAAQIGDGVTSIRSHVFYNCTSLNSVIVGNGVTSIGEWSFYNCISLESMTISENVTIIESYAFYDCKKLTSIALPDCITGVRYSAFRGCSSLTDVYYGGGAIAKKAISIDSNNTSLTNANWHYAICDHVYDNACDADCNECGSTREVGDHVYDNDIDTTCNECGAVREVKPLFGCFTYEIVDSAVTIIGCDSSVSGELEIPSDINGYPVMSIGDQAFYSCTGLTSVIIPDSVVAIGEGAFAGCGNLLSVAFGNNVTTIDSYAFFHCGITSIVLPKSVTCIYDDAFFGCKLDTVWYEGTQEDKGNIQKLYDEKLIYATWHYVNGACDSDCNECGAVREAEDHIYDDSFDTSCNVCGYIREVEIAATIVTLANAADGVQVSWGAIANADEYYVYRAERDASNVWSDFELIATVIDLTYLDTDVIDGTVYGYKVCGAYNAAEGTLSAQVNIKRLTTPTISVSQTVSGVQIKWTVNESAAKYFLYRSEYTNGAWSDWTRLITTTTANYSDLTAKNGVLYRYKLVANSGTMYGDDKISDEIMRLTVSSLSVTNQTSGIQVEWSANTAAEQYYLYRSKYQDGEWTAWGKPLVTTTDTSYLDTTAANGAKYRYMVRTVNGDHISGTKTGDILYRLTTPTMTLENVSSGMKISWTENTAASKYFIYRSYYENGAWTGWTKFITVSAGTTSYTDYNVTNGVQYRYMVRVYKGEDQSASRASNPMMRLTTPTVKPTAASNGIKLTWTANADATGYKVYRRAYDASTASYSDWELIVENTKSTTYTDTTATKGVTYQYTLRAVNGTSLSAVKASANTKW